MVQTLAVVYAAATTAGLLVALGSDLAGARRWIAAALVVNGYVIATVLVLRSAPLPRRAPGALVGLATVLIASAVLVPQEPVSALGVACLVVFTVVQACYSFPLPTALAHVAAGWLLVDGALLAHGGVHLATVLALDAILLALAVVSRRLAARACGARTDPLTGLPNRRAFDDLLQQLVAGGRTLSVALLDLDHFKEVNDTAGHEAGDRVLLRVAEVSARVLPRGAVLARQGGDEFALVFPGTSGADTVTAVRRICDVLAPTGLSAGVAEYETGESAAQLVRRADGALYAVKAAGGGRVELAGAAARSRR